MDKLTATITIKVPLRIKIAIQDKALEKGTSESLLCRNWLLEKLHESNFHMKDFLSNSDEGQED